MSWGDKFRDLLKNVSNFSMDDEVAPVSDAHVVVVTDENFEEVVLRANRPVLVDFWAEWCGPCKAFAPTIHKVAAEYADRLIVVKADLEMNRRWAEKLGIRAVPTLLYFNKGDVVKRTVGGVPLFRLKLDVDQLLESTNNPQS